MLRAAAGELSGQSPRTTVIADSGSENVNSEVDGLLEDKGLSRALAQVDVTFSNSNDRGVLEIAKAFVALPAFSGEHLSPLRRLVGFYVQQHNAVMPHAAFEGQTPDEVFFGRGDAGGCGTRRCTGQDSRGTDQGKPGRSVWSVQVRPQCRQRCTSNAPRSTMS